MNEDRQRIEQWISEDIKDTSRTHPAIHLLTLAGYGIGGLLGVVGGFIMILKAIAGAQGSSCGFGFSGVIFIPVLIGCVLFSFVGGVAGAGLAVLSERSAATKRSFKIHLYVLIGFLGLVGLVGGGAWLMVKPPAAGARH